MERNDEEREAKRVRQACLNCRRKKTRCSGERPTCAFCTRLGQECRWDDGYTGSTSNTAIVISDTPVNKTREADLAARVHMLESKLAMLDAYGLNSIDLAISQRRESISTHSKSASPETDIDRTISPLPNASVIKAAADIYLRHCWRQPYYYFEDVSLHRRIDEGVLPSYFLFALLATASRFSNEPLFDDHQFKAMEFYARQAWNDISEQSFSENHSLSIYAVQAASMLGVIDFVRGRPRLAWVKIGLSVRFAQSLGLTHEPDPSLSQLEQEEQRKTFWSVYLLDRLVSCGRNRPPTLLDEDLTVRLPTIRNYEPSEVLNIKPTLTDLCEVPEVVCLNKDDHFALLAFMASALGSIVRHYFMQSSKARHPPWDSRSEFTRIHGILLSFETYSQAVDPATFISVLEKNFRTPDGEFDRSACQFTASLILYHLNHCLLNHPLLVRQSLGQYAARVPPSFLRETFLRSVEHARCLANMFKDLQESRCLLNASFYGYAATVAAGTLKLRSLNPHTPDAGSAGALYNTCLQFLDNTPGHWEHFKRMSTALRAFRPSREMAMDLLSPTKQIQVVNIPEMEELSHLLDYGWLSDHARPADMTSFMDTEMQTNDSAPIPVYSPTPVFDFDNWNDFGGFLVQ